MLSIPPRTRLRPFLGSSDFPIFLSGSIDVIHYHHKHYFTVLAGRKVETKVHGFVHALSEGVIPEPISTRENEILSLKISQLNLIS